MIIPTIRLKKGAAEIIDQTLLPVEYRIIRLASVADVCEAITALRIRGAPALGIAGAYGLLVAVEERWGGDGVYFFDGDTGLDRVGAFPGTVAVEELRAVLERNKDVIAATRPTAVNLHWALERMAAVYRREWESGGAMLRALLDEAVAIHDEDLNMCRALGAHGAELLHDGDAVLTHCNTGGLAASGYGTALGVVFAAVESGKKIRVYADETRPLLQGARLTAWECARRNIPVTVLVDGASASLLSREKVSCVLVGADRIAANGDTANKVGTLNLAIVAKRFGVPFYVAAPSSTIDASLPDGTKIPIEERPADEVKTFAGVSVAAREADVYNPAFDVTPGELIAGIITENGVARPPFDFSAGTE